MQACCTAAYTCVSFDYNVAEYKCGLNEESEHTESLDVRADSGYNYYLKPTNDMLVGRITDGDPTSLEVTREIAEQSVTFNVLGF